MHVARGYQMCGVWVAFHFGMGDIDKSLREIRVRRTFEHKAELFSLGHSHLNDLSHSRLIRVIDAYHRHTCNWFRLHWNYKYIKFCDSPHFCPLCVVANSENAQRMALFWRFHPTCCTLTTTLEYDSEEIFSVKICQVCPAIFNGEPLILITGNLDLLLLNHWSPVNGQ